MASAKTPSPLLALPSHVRTLLFRHAISSTLRAAPVSSRALTRTYATYNPNIDPHPPSSSVNDAEVTHFNALASSWWDPHGSSRLLHLMNPLRHRFLRQCLLSSAPSPSSSSTPTPGLRLLDIGCGGGIFAESAARSPLIASVTALDPTPEVIAVARRHQRTDPALLEPGRLNYLHLAIEDLPIPSFSPSSSSETPKAGREAAEGEGGYDVISLFEVIEHVRDPAPFLRTALQHLKPGGWLVGSTIARTGVSWLTTKLVAEDILRIVPPGTHEWKQYIQPSELRDWARLQEDLDVGVGGEGWRVMGVVYVPGFGWREVKGSEEWGNYFFAVRKKGVGE